MGKVVVWMIGKMCDTLHGIVDLDVTGLSNQEPDGTIEYGVSPALCQNSLES